MEGRLQGFEESGRSGTGSVLNVVRSEQGVDERYTYGTNVQLRSQVWICSLLDQLFFPGLAALLAVLPCHLWVRVFHLILCQVQIIHWHIQPVRFYFILCRVVSWGTGDWTQDPKHALQTGYHYLISELYLLVLSQPQFSRKSSTVVFHYNF